MFAPKPPVFHVSSTTTARPVFLTDLIIVSKSRGRKVLRSITSHSTLKSFDIISSCIEMVYNNEDSWAASDCTKKELKEFVEQLSSKQFKEIEKFFDTMPKLTHTLNVKNPKTGVNNEVTLEGLTRFFG